jgi:hypothetical protein
MANPLETLKKAKLKVDNTPETEDESDDTASEMRAEDKQMDEKMTPEQLLSDIKDDLDLLFKKLKSGK